MSCSNLEGERENSILHASYQAFLLRCWQEETDGEPAWRFTLLTLGDKGSMQGFASLEDMTAALRLSLAACVRSPTPTAFGVHQREGE